MPEPKTRPTDVSVDDFLATVPSEERRADARALLALMREVTGEEPRMWGPSIVGFGTYPIRYADGKELDWPVAGFSPRKANLVVYIMPGFDRYAALLARLGKHSTGKSCLYLRRLREVDMTVLRELVTASVERVRRNHPA